MFNEAQLTRLSTLIAERTGLNTFDRGRNRLIEVLHHHPEAIHHPDAYLRHLSILPENHPTWQALLAELTVGETHFMRDTAQIYALRHHILPTLIRQKRQDQSLRLRVWSAGCATGEEPYTLAILLYELLSDIAQWDVQILGTDINEAALEVAREARYRDWSFRSTPSEIRERYFVPVNPRSSTRIWELRPEIRKLVRFQYSNLVSGNQEIQELVVCRNVLIYFTRPQAELAEKRLTKTLQSGGWLMLSPVEAPRHTRQQYEAHRFGEVVLFRKHPQPGTEIQATEATYKAPVTETKMVGVALTVGESTAYQAAVEAFQAGRLDEALRLTQALRDAYQPAVLSLMASILLGLGNKHAAFDYLMQALAANSLYPDAHYLIALLHMGDNDFVAARIALRAAIYCRPDFALAHLVSGDLFMREGDKERAVRAWETARRFVGMLPVDLPLSDVADVKAGQLVELLDYRLNNA